MNIQDVNVSDLRIDGDNPNEMSEGDFEALKRNIKRFGFIVPIITNKDLLIADGEHRWRAAKDLAENKELWKISYDNKGNETGRQPTNKIPVMRLDIEDVDRRVIRQILNKLRGTHKPNLDRAEFEKLVEMNAMDDLHDLLPSEDLHEWIQYAVDEPIPDNLIGEAKDKPPKVIITFVHEAHLVAAKKQLEEMLKDYPGSYLSVSAGEI